MRESLNKRNPTAIRLKKTTVMNHAYKVNSILKLISVPSFWYLFNVLMVRTGTKINGKQEV